MHIGISILIANALITASSSLSTPKAISFSEPVLTPADYNINGNFSLLIAGGYRPIHNTLAKHMVSIRTARPTEYFGDNHLCAGVIVAPTLILTAAHCVVDFYKATACPGQLIVVAGAPNRLRCDNSTMEFAVVAVLPHDRFKRHSGYDIALLALASPIPHDNDNIKIIAISKERQPLSTNCISLGWGQLFMVCMHGPYAAELVYVDLSIVNDIVCAEKFSNLYGQGMICAHDKLNAEGELCRGDSGGPLICNGNLVGIASWGMLCKPGYPTVFTDVAYYYKWIKAEAMKQHIVHPSMGTLYTLFLSISN